MFQLISYYFSQATTGWVGNPCIGNHTEGRWQYPVPWNYDPWEGNPNGAGLVTKFFIPNTHNIFQLISYYFSPATARWVGGPRIGNHTEGCWQYPVPWNYDPWEGNPNGAGLVPQIFFPNSHSIFQLISYYFSQATTGWVGNPCTGNHTEGRWQYPVPWNYDPWEENPYGPGLVTKMFFIIPTKCFN